jgi:hypothetical protein
MGGSHARLRFNHAPDQRVWDGNDTARDGHSQAALLASSRSSTAPVALVDMFESEDVVQSGMKSRVLRGGGLIDYKKTTSAQSGVAPYTLQAKERNTSIHNQVLQVTTTVRGRCHRSDCPDPAVTFSGNAAINHIRGRVFPGQEAWQSRLKNVSGAQRRARRLRRQRPRAHLGTSHSPLRYNSIRDTECYSFCPRYARPFFSR